MTEIEVARPAAIDPRAGAQLVRRGADLVVLAEQAYLRLFTVCAAGVALGSLVSLWIGARHTSQGQEPVTIALAAAGVIGSAVVCVRRERLYLWLRGGRWRRFVPVALAYSLVVINGPNSPSDWIALPCLMSVAALEPTRWQTPAVGVLGALAYVAGNLVWGAAPLGGYAMSAAGRLIAPVAAARVTTEVFGLFMLRLHRAEQVHARRRGVPLKVRAISDAQPGTPPPEVSTPAPRRRRTAADRLTARQLEVAVLLADGLSHAEIAACLGISVRQVDRLVAEGRERAGAATSAELVALLIAGLLVPRPAPTAGAADTRQSRG